MKIFLGGTCNDSNWRELLKPLLQCEYFDPVVKDWTPECQAKEIEERGNADYVLYVITPKATGVYSVAEAVDDSNKRSKKTILALVENDGVATYTRHQWNSLQQVSNMVADNGGITLVYKEVDQTNMEYLANVLNVFTR